MLGSLNDVDVALFRLLNRDLALPVLDGLMTLLSSKYTWLAVAVAALIYAAVKRRRAMLRFCVTLALTIGLVDFVTYQLVKPAFARERPCRQFQDERLLQQWCGGDYGFPSNHAANGMAATVQIGRTYGRKWALAAFALTLLVGLSRIYIGVHFPGDVLGGFIFGALLGYGADFLGRFALRALPLRRI